jgi:hypothetical protein
MRTKLTLLALAGNAILAGATYAYYGWKGVGTAVAARNTARFSAIVFIAVFVARKSEKWGKDFVALVTAFVAAHYFHFVTVIVHHWVGVPGGLHRLFVKGWPAPVIGFTLTTLALVRWPKVNALAMYLLWLSFTLALATNIKVHPLTETPLVLGVSIAMIVHLKQIFANRGTASAAKA